MIENQYNSQPLPNNWTINDFKEKENQRVIRKFINSAIYVEKTVTEMPPQRKTSPICLNDDSDENEMNNSKSICKSIISRRKPDSGYETNNKSSRYFKSGSHLENTSDEKLHSPLGNLPQSTPESGYITNDQSSNNSSTNPSENSFKTVICVKEKDFKQPLNNFNNELRLSLSYLNTNRTDKTSSLDAKEKEEIVQNWIAKKQLEKKHKALQEAKQAKQREEERKKLIERERETFKRWLAAKKKEEERRKLQKELAEQEQKLKEAEREKRKVENEISFNLWLRKKEKRDLEMKIREKLALLQMYEKKQIRMAENERAYQEWLENAKTRQKPIPMNRGLQSLCSSTSVTYINPLPWTPNIDPVPKPSSQ